MYRVVVLSGCLTSAVFVACGETKSEDTSEETDSAVPFHDVDGDGFMVEDGDCNDADPEIFPFDRTANHGTTGCGWVVSSGIDYACGLSSAGEISCWGNDNGTDNLKAPEGIFIDISVGTGHGCARDANNMVTCWGWDTYGQGPAPEIPMKAISAGAYQTCGIDMNDKVICWGGYNARNWNWQDISAASIHTASYHSCAITTDSNVVCAVPTDESGAPVITLPPAPLEDDTYVSIASISVESNCALNDQGAVTCWGSTGDSYEPPSADVTMLDMGSTDHYCALLADQSVTCWGEIWQGSDQGQTQPPEGAFQSIDLGQYHSCGVRTTGDIECWGSMSGDPSQ